MDVMKYRVERSPESGLWLIIRAGVILLSEWTWESAMKVLTSNCQGEQN